MWFQYIVCFFPWCFSSLYFMHSRNSELPQVICMESPAMVAVGRKRGFLFKDLDRVIIYFLPPVHFPVSAAVCKCWAKLTKGQKEFNQMAAEELLTEALLSMKRGDCPLQTSQLLNRAVVLFPGLAEASFRNVTISKQIYEGKQALECLEQALAMQPTEIWRRKLMALKLGVL